MPHVFQFFSSVVPAVARRAFEEMSEFIATHAAEETITSAGRLTE